MIYPSTKSKKKARYGIYECPYCKKSFYCNTNNVIRRLVKSCGCIKNESIRKARTIHGIRKSPIYNSYKGMIARCYKPRCRYYNIYGGRGITVCDEWRNNILSFYHWSILNGWECGLEIDRINNDGNYEPSNCRWTTPAINSQNSRILRSTNTSGFRGVDYRKKNNKWRSRITHNNIKHNLGDFNTASDAATAYNNYVIENGTNHPLNIIK